MGFSFNKFGVPFRRFVNGAKRIASPMESAIEGTGLAVSNTLKVTGAGQVATEIIDAGAQTIRKNAPSGDGTVKAIKQFSGDAVKEINNTGYMKNLNFDGIWNKVKGGDPSNDVIGHIGDWLNDKHGISDDLAKAYKKIEYRNKVLSNHGKMGNKIGDAISGEQTYLTGDILKQHEAHRERMLTRYATAGVAGAGAIGIGSLGIGTSAFAYRQVKGY